MLMIIALAAIAAYAIGASVVALTNDGYHRDADRLRPPPLSVRSPLREITRCREYTPHPACTG